MVSTRRYYIIGALASLLLLGFYLGIVTLAESWTHAVDQLAELWYWMTPLIIGFGMQAGLFFFIRHAVRRRKAAVGSVAVSGGVSAGSMVACCAHHLVDVLPLLGLSGAALFLADYQVFFIAIGVVSNIAGIAIMLATIQRHGLSSRMTHWKLNLNLVKNSFLIATLPLLAAIFFMTT